MMGDHQVVNGSIKDLSLMAGIYNPEKRSDWIYQVLYLLFILIIGYENTVLIFWNYFNV